VKQPRCPGPYFVANVSLCAEIIYSNTFALSTLANPRDGNSRKLIRLTSRQLSVVVEPLVVELRSGRREVPCRLTVIDATARVPVDEST